MPQGSQAGDHHAPDIQDRPDRPGDLDGVARPARTGCLGLHDRPFGRRDPRDYASPADTPQVLPRGSRRRGTATHRYRGRLHTRRHRYPHPGNAAGDPVHHNAARDHRRREYNHHGLPDRERHHRRLPERAGQRILHLQEDPIRPADPLPERLVLPSGTCGRSS